MFFKLVSEKVEKVFREDEGEVEIISIDEEYLGNEMFLNFYCYSIRAEKGSRALVRYGLFLFMVYVFILKIICFIYLCFGEKSLLNMLGLNIYILN